MLPKLDNSNMDKADLFHLCDELNGDLINLERKMYRHEHLLWDDVAGDISSFRGEFGFLSNFYDHPITVDGIWEFPTSEHAYQAFKTSSREWFHKIATAKTASKSKKLGQECPIRENWSYIKESVMHSILLDKFSRHHQELLDKLISTYPLYLREGNTWGDQFWGSTYSEAFQEWRGKNRLGHILMLIRYRRILEKQWQDLLIDRRSDSA